MCNIFGGIPRPALMSIEGYHAKRIGMGAGNDIADHSSFIGFRLISLDVSAAKFSKIIEHDVNGRVISECAWGQRCVAAGDLGFLILIQVFDRPDL